MHILRAVDLRESDNPWRLGVLSVMVEHTDCVETALEHSMSLSRRGDGKRCAR